MRRGQRLDSGSNKWQTTTAETDSKALVPFSKSDYYTCNGMSSSDSERIVKLAYSELSLGRILGQGGFSVVSEVTSIDLDDVYDTSDEETKIRKEFARQINGSGQRKFVLKMLRTDLPVEEHMKGVVDLAIEADFLRVLSHPNIISMRAVANTDPHENRFFVVLDRLGITLDRKFNYWRKLVGANSGYWFPICGYCCSNAPALHSVWKDRMGSALQIAKAIQHLHSQRIIYRDLKPDNIGYDAMTGQHLKIFDFGLAKRLQEAESVENGLYLLTGNTGSLRYMSPEVASDKPYNESVDAYSFGILFWQICSLQTPFAGYSERMHAEKVVKLGERPKPDRSWPGSWVQLMTDCWHQDFQLRPDFDQIVAQLEDNVNDLELDDGIIPTRSSDIRAKKRKKKAKDQKLDVDTRLAGTVDAENGSKRPEADIV